MAVGVRRGVRSPQEARSLWWEVAVVIGALGGAVARLACRFADSVMLRVVDLCLSSTFLFLVLIVAFRYGASVLSLSLIIGGFTGLVPARLVRAMASAAISPSRQHCAGDTAESAEVFVNVAG